MGLYSNLNDVQSDSIPLFLLILIANCVNYIRSLLIGCFQSMGFSRFSSIESVLGDTILTTVGTGLAGLIVISEQNDPVYSEAESAYSDKCVVCLCRLREGERVRKLTCRHVFHKACLDGWSYDHLNLTCPLCRSPLLSEERFASTESRVADDLVTWFTMR